MNKLVIQKSAKRQQMGVVKKISVLAVCCVATMLFALESCDPEDLLSVEEKAQKASNEFCECMKDNSLSTCKEKLNSNYGYYSQNDDFINAFNNANNCGITISKGK